MMGKERWRNENVERNSDMKNDYWHACRSVAIVKCKWIIEIILFPLLNQTREKKTEEKIAVFFLSAVLIYDLLLFWYVGVVSVTNKRNERSPTLHYTFSTYSNQHCVKLYYRFVYCVKPTANRQLLAMVIAIKMFIIAHCFSLCFTHGILCTWCDVHFHPVENRDRINSRAIWAFAVYMDCVLFCPIKFNKIIFPPERGEFAFIRSFERRV